MQQQIAVTDEDIYIDIHIHVQDPDKHSRGREFRKKMLGAKRQGQQKTQMANGRGLIIKTS